MILGFIKKILRNLIKRRAKRDDFSKEKMQIFEEAKKFVALNEKRSKSYLGANF
jgi:hypothetical protein